MEKSSRGKNQVPKKRLGEIEKKGGRQKNYKRGEASKKKCRDQKTNSGERGGPNTLKRQTWALGNVSQGGQEEETRKRARRWLLKFTINHKKKAKNKKVSIKKMQRSSPFFKLESRETLSTKGKGGTRKQAAQCVGTETKKLLKS